MNSPANQFIESLILVDNSHSEQPTASTESPKSPEQSIPLPARQQPIPPPNNPRQYRAIGLVYGQYQQSEENLTQGILKTEEGTEIDTVLLGRMISLIKNHVDLAQSHLWVVYPHIRQEEDHLHLQIVGLWEPETLKQNQILTQNSEEEPKEQGHGYFSIRGEVAFASKETEIIIVKIRQAPKTADERPKFFKIKLKGLLPEKPVSRFWDLEAQLVGHTLILQSAKDLGFAATKKPIKRSDKEKAARKGGTGKRNQNRDRHPRQADASGEKRTGAPLPKPLPKPSKGDRDL